MKQAWMQYVAAPIAFAVGVAAAAEGVRPGDKPLVVNGDLALTTLDFDAYMERVPAARRKEFRAEYEKINPTVDALWVRRVLASRALAAGMDKDPIMAARMRLAQEDVLADAYTEAYMQKVTYPDLEPRARELYKAHVKEFTVPETVTAQHILVSTKTYPREAAKARADEAYKRALAGEDFGKLAEEYTDNKASREINAMSITQFVKPLPEAILKLGNNPGALMPPTESEYGFHIIKMKSLAPPRVKAFEEVREGLIEIERGKVLDEHRSKLVEGIRTDPKTTLNVENVRDLKSDFKITDEMIKNSIVIQRQ